MITASALLYSMWYRALESDSCPAFQTTLTHLGAISSRLLDVRHLRC